ncbi:hypothetical protein BHM03_00061282 [Ensete ventricosum]|nr:hypothetical protein BHM03_00061282 [Ensete ventricosum]
MLQIQHLAADMAKEVEENGKDDTLRHWLRQLRGAASDAEDLIDECRFQLLARSNTDNGAPMPHEEGGTAIVATTRSESVAKFMQTVLSYDLIPLPEEECQLLLFEHHAFGSHNLTDNLNLLKDLVNLRGKFEIAGLHNMASVDYVKDALKDLRHIAKLILSSGINYDNGNLGESDFSLFDGVNEDNQSLSNVHDELHTSTEDGVVRVSEWSYVEDGGQGRHPPAAGARLAARTTDIVVRCSGMVSNKQDKGFWYGYPVSIAIKPLRLYGAGGSQNQQQN